MRVAKNTDVWSSAIKKRSSFARELAPRIQNVPNGDPKPCKFNRRLRLNTTRLILVDVAGDRRHRSDTFQAIDNGGLADITGMNDMIDILKIPQDGRIEQTMCVGDDTDTDGPRPAHGAEPDDAPKLSRTLDHSNENGSGFCFGISASRALS